MKTYRPRAEAKRRALSQPIPRRLAREYRYILYTTEAQADLIRAKFPGLKLARAFQRSPK